MEKSSAGRRYGEEKIDKQNEFFKNIIDSLPYVFMVIDVKNYTVEMTNTAADGSALSEGVTCYAISHHRNKPCMGGEHPCPIEIAKKTKKPIVVEHIHRDKEGKCITVEVYAYPIFDDKGNVSKIIECSFDVTQQKRAEQHLKQQSRTLQILSKTTPSMLIITDEHGKNKYVSSNCEKITGYTPEELHGKVVWWVHDDDRARATKIFKDTYKRGTGRSNFEYKAVKKNGDIWWASSSWGPIFDDNGTFTGVVFQTSDITARKIAEARLYESEEIFRNLAEQSPNMIFINVKGRIVYANKMCKEIMGYTKDEFYSPDFKFMSLIAPEYRVQQEKNLSAHFRGKDVTPSTFAILTKKGGKIEAILNTKLIRFKGENAILGIITDITRIKRMERKIRKSLGEKEILLKEIHHRVKNNLQIIYSLLNLQARHLHDERSRDLFDQTKNRVKTMALIHENLYRSENLMFVDFGKYAHVLATHLLRSYGKSTVELQIEIEKVSLDIERAIHCALIINELVTNAIKHAFSNGEKNKILIVFRTDDAQYVLSVEDNGKGPPNDLDYMKTESLGLQLVCALTKQLHGNISLDKNHGTKFTIAFRKK